MEFLLKWNTIGNIIGIEKLSMIFLEDIIIPQG